MYSFPRGHTKSEEIPHIDTLFFDWDIPSDGAYGRPSGPEDADLLAWYADMKPLLAILSDVAEALIAAGKEQYVRFSLSGHKGVHMFLDFPPLRPDLGSQDDYKMGLRTFVSEYIEDLETVLGYSVDEYLDVDSSDLGRLTRLPNTVHEKATRNFGESRYCVAVSPEELVGLTPGEYIRLTQSPRPLPDEALRVPSSTTSTRLSACVDQAAERSSASVGARTFVFERAPTTLSEYERNADESITFHGVTNSVEQILSRRPGMWEYRERKDAFDHGDQSHFFEFAVIIELVLHRVPVDLILRYFEGIPRYDKQFTRSRIAEILAWGADYPVSLRKLKSRSPEFLP
ncbi:hypothetical protein DV707_10870 [Halobellus limi]|uniref:DNA primase n=1 Tax=Halobellus limi TaxID=699433 RepID=A0A4D6H2N7_9EURY|nr:hypothetical protein DV707_10870 [Halobellus limi]